MDPVVFFGSAAAVVGFCIFGGLWTSSAAAVFESLRERVVGGFGWYYALVTTATLVFVLWLMLGRFAKVRLGPPDSKPAFSLASWFAMLFSAGMGTGLVFWGVAEPLHHYAAPFRADPETPAAAREAMRFSFFHWGLHPWAIYGLLGAAIAYFHFRRDLPLAPRALLYPLIGDRMHGPAGQALDILCTVGTLLGVATSLGLGAMQINAGVAMAFDLPRSVPLQVAIIALITVIATLSVVAGIQAGIRRLSHINLGLSALLLLFVIAVGPTVYIIETLVGASALYLQHLPEMSLYVSFAGNKEWQADWTFFYWGWWISWSPFVGIFIARVSCGRTMREFMAGVLLVPTLGTFVWFAAFGGTGLHGEMFGAAGLAADVRDEVSISLHALLGGLPLATFSQTLATVVIIVFFITSSDSGSLVDDMVTSGGHPHPPKAQRVFWATAEGAVAATLLLVGGLRAIQNASISLGLLMSVVLVLAAFGLQRSLSRHENPARAP